MEGDLRIVYRLTIWNVLNQHEFVIHTPDETI
jgi:hypothetical protein